MSGVLAKTDHAMLRKKDHRKLLKRKLRRQFKWRLSGAHHPVVRELLSHHVFLLPFKWSRCLGEDKECLPDRSDLKELTERLLPEWESAPFELDTIANYNEWHYFYDYVREVLYETPQQKEPSRFIRHFRHRKAQGGTYTITAPAPSSRKTADGTETYTLEIDEVYLHLYYTGVGVLSFHLDNRDAAKSTPDDILIINQFGRRVFPAFYPIKQKYVGQQAAFSFSFDQSGQENFKPNGIEVAQKIEVAFGEGTQRQTFPEDWSGLQKQMSDYAEAVQKIRSVGGAAQKLPVFKPAGFCSPFLSALTDTTDQESRKYNLYSVLDDRMFVTCWYGSDKMANELGPTYGNKLDQKKKGATSSHQWWYKYAFVDGNSMTVENPEMQKRLIDEATYSRWAQFGTWYGATDYSFVILTNSLPTLRQFNAEFIVTHLQSIYYRLVELTLVQRACVQRFSDEVTHISRLDVPEPNEDTFTNKVTELAADANDLYKRYIRFVNGIYFREVTAQVQGIELYEKLQRQSRLPMLVDSLKDEIHELHNYVRQETDRSLLLAQKAQKESEEGRTNFLTLLGALFLAPALLVAVYDLGFYGDCLQSASGFFYPATIIAAIATAGLFYWAFVNHKSSEKLSHEDLALQAKQLRNRRPWAIGLYLLLLFAPMCYGLLYCPPPTATTVVTGEVSILPPNATVPTKDSLLKPAPLLPPKVPRDTDTTTPSPVQQNSKTQ